MLSLKSKSSGSKLNRSEPADTCLDLLRLSSLLDWAGFESASGIVVLLARLYPPEIMNFYTLIRVFFLMGGPDESRSASCYTASS